VVGPKVTPGRPTISLVGLASIAFFPALWFGIGATALAGQTQHLESAKPTGQPIAPFFEGWYSNPDGTYTFSFGYHNFNTEETVHIPLGAGNRIEPAQFDRGEQPTLYPARPSRRERGVFTVTVPGEFGERRQPVVWTVTAHGTTYSVPAKIGVGAYELDYAPRAGGSVAPLVGFESDGERGQNPQGMVWSQTLEAAVGQPLEVRVWVSDPSARPDDQTRPDAGVDVPVGLRWFTHRGPVEASFLEAEGEVGPLVGSSEDSWATMATFTEPGDYVLRVRADNWTARDSSAGNQCCWTNGYVRVSVRP